jgi:glycosyltransferase involved in cell wall biosynthesis
MLINPKKEYRNNSIVTPVLSDISRPLWSVMIPTYNCADYLRETLASVLAQDPGRDIMQIEVVDDGSTKDNPEAVVREIGGDRVKFFRQSQNVGHIKNFDTCLQHAQGKLIHLLHGDDLVLPGFYENMQLAFDKNKEIGAAFCRHIFADDCGNWQHISVLEQPTSGILHNWLEKIIVNHPIQTPSMVVRRNTYEKLGGFDYRLSCAEDWEMWMRIAMHFPIWYEIKPLAVYRMRGTSLSANAFCSGENAKNAYRAIEILQSHLYNSKISQDKSNMLLRQARKHSANYVLYIARQYFKKADLEVGQMQINEALKFGIFPSTIARILLIYAWFLYLQYRTLIQKISTSLNLFKNTSH